MPNSPPKQIGMFTVENPSVLPYVIEVVYAPLSQRLTAVAMPPHASAAAFVHFLEPVGDSGAPRKSNVATDVTYGDALELIDALSAAGNCVFQQGKIVRKGSAEMVWAEQSSPEPNANATIVWHSVRPGDDNPTPPPERRSLDRTSSSE